MIREAVTKYHPERWKRLRWHGGDVSRLEGVSDAVFAFAITLLVVSLEVPKTYTELMDAMSGFFAFGICFVILAAVWYNHYLFFRRFGIEDRYVLFLNAVLLFVILFYIYPLKFLFTYLIDRLVDPEAAQLAMAGITDTSSLMYIYSGGYLAIFTILWLMFYYAWCKRDELGLSGHELVWTRVALDAKAIYAFVGVLSISIAAVGGPEAAPYAGLVYILIGPLQALYGFIGGNYWSKKFVTQPTAEDDGTDA